VLFSSLQHKPHSDGVLGWPHRDCPWLCGSWGPAARGDSWTSVPRLRKEEALAGVLFPQQISRYCCRENLSVCLPACPPSPVLQSLSPVKEIKAISLLRKPIVINKCVFFHSSGPLPVHNSWDLCLLFKTDTNAYTVYSQAEILNYKMSLNMLTFGPERRVAGSLSCIAWKRLLCKSCEYYFCYVWGVIYFLCLTDNCNSFKENEI